MLKKTAFEDFHSTQDYFWVITQVVKEDTQKNDFYHSLHL